MEEEERNGLIQGNCKSGRCYRKLHPGNGECGEVLHQRNVDPGGGDVRESRVGESRSYGE